MGILVELTMYRTLSQCTEEAVKFEAYIMKLVGKYTPEFLENTFIVSDLQTCK